MPPTTRRRDDRQPPSRALSTSRVTWPWSRQPTLNPPTPKAAQPALLRSEQRAPRGADVKDLRPLRGRPFGPIPDPDALPGAAQQQAEETVRKIHHKNSRLTGPAPAPKIPTTSSGDVSFPRLYGDLEAERFELSDRATTLLFLGVAAQRGGAGIVVERTVR